MVTALAWTVGCQSDRADRSLPIEDGLRTVRVLYAGADEGIFSPTWDDTPKFLIFEPLVTYEANSCSDIVGGLAERWDPSPDWKTWEIELRPDVRWHDGVPVTSADVAFTVKLLQHPEVTTYGAESVESIEIIDAHRFRAHLKEPGDWPLNGWMVVYPEHLLKDLDPAKFYEWDFWNRPVGNGPFRYVGNIPETMVELEANSDYYLGRPSLDRVRIQFKADGEGQAGLLELLAGNVDVVGGLLPFEASMLEEEPGLASYLVYHASSNWLIWNFSDPHFSDVRVRQALAHATDRNHLHRALKLPDGVPVTDGTFFLCEPQDIQVPEPYSYDPELALRLLAEAGWEDEDNDAVLDSDGEPFTFTLLLDHGYLTVAVLVQDQLREIGVEMKLQVLDGNLVAQHFDAGDFEAILVRRSMAERRMIGKDSPLGLLDLELAEAVEGAMTEPDIDLKLQLWKAAGEQYRDLAPALFLYPGMSLLVADERLKGIGEPGAITRRMLWRHAFGGLPHLWVEKGQEARP
jgi:peptide/nickel transport system substrate-binding protein